MLNNNLRWILQIVFFFIILTVSCDVLCPHRNSECVCETVVRSARKYLNDAPNVSEYIIDVGDYVNVMKNRDLKKISDNCSRAEVAACLLESHPLIDSVLITPGGRVITYYVTDTKMWSNLFIK